MNIKNRRALRAVVAVVAAGSLLGVQALTSGASADTSPIVWRPGQTAPTGTGFWSNACPTGSGNSATGIPNDSSNLHRVLTDDSTGVESTRAMTDENGSDVGWQYRPGSGVEGGPSFTLTNPNSTQSISALVQGSASGQAVVYYATSATASDYYVGIAPMEAPATPWVRKSASIFSWYHWSSNLLGGSSWHAQNVPFLGSAPTPKSIADFANGANDTNKPITGGLWYASIEYGCGASSTFGIDHIQINDGVTPEYDLQNPATSTTTTGATTIAPGKSATITAVVKSGTTTVTEGGTTIWSCTSACGEDQSWSPTPYFSTVGTRGFIVYPARNTQYKVAFNGTTNYASSDTAAPVTVQVRPTLALKVDRSTTNVRVTRTFTATFRPARSGVPVSFQQKVGTGWQTLGTASTNSSGVAVLKRSRAAAGLWTVRAVAPTQSGLLATNAPTISVRVYQPVTIPINASPRTLYVGGSIHVGGVLTQHLRGVWLQLQQRVGKRWITYARTKTGPRGGYTFIRRANNVGTATFRVVAPAAGYRRGATSATRSVRIIYRPRPVYTPPPASSGGGSGVGGGSSSGGGGNGIG